ncbi:MAG: prephenate dehydratase [Clostridia bacterium]|nr:prephenate dehydratase [Clostridia bacterium]
MNRIEELRKEIDTIDSGIVDLYRRRMDVAHSIGQYKREHGIPVSDPGRERALLNRLGEAAGPEHEYGVRALFNLLLSQSRASQLLDQRPVSPLGESIRGALRDTPPLFPPKAVVACQGLEGAYSQIACEKLFSAPSIMYFRQFDHVFDAVDSGLCRYGILPIENSLAGSVSSVYDSMRRHRFFIVRSVRVKIDHTLLALPGAAMEDIREVYSHQQAIMQCSRFLADHPSWQVHVCENTAMAARTVAESGRKDIAAISSVACAALYGLNCVARDIQNNPNNHTRFICIARQPEIYPGADHTSLMLSLPDKPGSLYELLGRFSAQGINLTRLESRPIPGQDFEFMFYFEFESSVYSPQFTRLMEELSATLEQFSYLGSYSEIV